MSRRRPPSVRRPVRIASLIASALGVVYAVAVGYPVPAAAAATTYEAEAAALSGGATVASDHTGYTGSGFVAGYVDGNKGNANTTFSVSAAGTGSYTLNLRYANGTTAQMSLSLYVNGSKLQQILLPATTDWNTWTTQAVTTTLAAGTDTVAYKFDTTDLGNVNLDNLTVSSVTPPQPGQYEAEAGFFNSGPSVATAIAGYSGSGYLTGFTNQGARVIVSATVPSAGAYSVALRYANSSGSAQSISLYLNGLKNQQLNLAAGSGWQSASQSLSLRSGLNLIGYQTDSGNTGNVAIDQVTVTGGQALTASGATLPYTEYRAASASTNGCAWPTPWTRMMCRHRSSFAPRDSPHSSSSDAGGTVLVRPVDDCRFQDINRSVCEVPRRVIDLLMETHHGAAIIKFQNAAGPGVVGPKAKHRYQMAGAPCAVSRDQSANVEVGQIVGMSQQERLALKPFSIRKHGPAGPEQFLLVD